VTQAVAEDVKEIKHMVSSGSSVVVELFTGRDRDYLTGLFYKRQRSFGFVNYVTVETKGPL
jgi:hypothetical protein